MLKTKAPKHFLNIFKSLSLSFQANNKTRQVETVMFVYKQEMFTFFIKFLIGEHYVEKESTELWIILKSPEKLQSYNHHLSSFLQQPKSCQNDLKM